MLKKTTWTLGALLAFTFFVATVAAVQPAPVELPQPEAAAPDLAEMLEADLEADPLMSVDQPAPETTPDAELLSAPGHYGICWTSCFPCTSSAQCPYGETCRFGVFCP